MPEQAPKTYETPSARDIPYTEAINLLSKDTYEKARASINVPDEVLILKVTSGEGHSFSDPTEQILMADIRDKAVASYLESRLKGNPLFDIGGGGSGVGHYLGMRSIDPPLRSDTSYGPPGVRVTDIDFGVSEYTLIDPYIDETVISKTLELRQVKTRSDIKDDTREQIINSIRLSKQDGLTALKALPDNAGNVVMSSIDSALIMNSDYLRRLAQEAFRVVPTDGVFLANNCPEIEHEASLLFPHKDTFGSNSIMFSKEPIPPKLPLGIVTTEKLFNKYRELPDSG